MSGRFEIVDTPLAGLRLVKRKPFGDSRGYLERMFCTEELSSLLQGRAVAQINHTLTAVRGTVRGLHFQHPPHGELKFVSCLRGQVFDVAVDLRRDSPTFLHWHGELLSADNHATLAIPEGFAHGFQTLVDDCEMLYFHTAAYCQEAEGGLHAEDPRLGIRWPLPVGGLSPRDGSHAYIGDDYRGVMQ